MTADPYEAVLYPGFPFAQTHPDRLFLLGVLHGLDPAPPDDCRVLEIGCGDGINLVSLADAAPGVRGLGIDRAAAPLERGRRYARELGLDLEFRALDLLDAGDLEGPFDYVVAHGVYAWVPPDVQAALLELTGRVLAPQGIAFVSYNALPGGHVRRAMRDLLRFHAKGFSDPAMRVARAREIQQAMKRWADRDDGFGIALNKELARLDRLSDHSLIHDDLGDVWEPVALSDFCDRAAAHGLRYLAEAELTELKRDRFPDGVEELMREYGGDDVVAREQYGDLIVGRPFRQTLLCRAEAGPAPEPVPGGIHRLTATTAHHPDPLADGRYASAVDAACAALARDEPAEPAALLEAFRLGLVELAARPARHASGLPRRPEATRLARLMAAEGPSVVSASHESLRYEDPFVQRVIVLADGTRDFNGLLEGVLASVGKEIIVEVSGRPVTDGEALREPFAERLAEVLQELVEREMFLA